MPAMVGQALPRVSQLVVDEDLTIPAAYKLVTKRIQANGGQWLSLYDESGKQRMYVTAEGVKIQSDSILYVDTITRKTTSGAVAFSNGLKTDTIDDNGGGLINILESCQLAATKYLAAPTLLGDIIEDQAGTGAAPFPLGIETDDINEYTASHGIDINDPVLLDALITKLTQMYLTAGASDTLRKSSDSEAIIANPGAVWTLVKGSFTIPDNYVGSGNAIRIKWAGKTQNAGGLPKQAVFVNGVNVGGDRSITNAYANLSVDISGVSAGDVIAIYSYDLSGVTGQHYAKEFRVCCDDTVADVMGTLTWP